MKVTLSELARYLGISEASVSLALNDKKGVSPRTRKKVLEAADKLGYTPNYFARSLATQTGNSIGLIVPEVENPFYGALTQRIDRAVRANGYQLLLGFSDFSLKTEEDMIKQFIAMRASGIIISPVYEYYTSDSYRQTVTQSETRILYVGSHYDFQHHYVMTNLMEGSYQLTKQLLDRGYRRIVFLSGDPEVVIARERLMGFQAAYTQNGIQEGSQVIVCHQFNFDEAYQLTKEMLKKDEPLDAIISMNDIMALGVMKAILETGRKIPEDIAVAGYDDVIFSSLSTVPLTTVRQPIDELAQMSVDRLLSLKEQERTEQMVQIKVTPELIIRSSV